MGRIFQQCEVPIIIKKGSTLSFPIYYKTDEGVVIDITGYTAKLQVRKTPNHSGDADIELTTENGGLILDGTGGKVYPIFYPDDTLSLESGYKGYWDIFLIPNSTIPFYFLGGTFEISASVTKVGS